MKNANESRKEVAMTEYKYKSDLFFGPAQAMGASSWSMMNQGSGL
jgi:hypothetical protein